MRSLVQTILTCCLVLSLACSQDGGTGSSVKSIEDLVVRNNEITGWTYSGAGWVANNVSELTQHIDGLADIYQRHGFVEAVHQSYQGTIDDGTRTLGLTVYNQGNTSNARETYEDPEVGLSGAIDWAAGAGDQAHYARYGGLSQALTFYRGSYFVYLEINYDTEESLNILKQFALNVDGKIQ